jgi:hypothetical protein
MRRKTVTTNLRYIVDWSAPIFTALPGLQDRRPRPDEASANPALRPWQRPGPPELTEDLHRFGAESKRFLDRSSLRHAAPSRVPGSGRGRPALPLPSVEPPRCARIDNQPVAVPGGARLPSSPDLAERLQPDRYRTCHHSHSCHHSVTVRHHSPARDSCPRIPAFSPRGRTGVWREDRWHSAPGFRLTIRRASKLVSLAMNLLPNTRSVTLFLPFPDRQTVFLPKQRWAILSTTA